MMCSVDPRALGALRKTGRGGGGGGLGGEEMDEMNLSVFHAVSNRVHGKCSRNGISSAARLFFSKSKKLYGNHIT